MKSVSSFVIACVLAWSATATAQSSKAAATIQFDTGRALLKQGKYEEACTAFEASQKLDPANGTLFNIAECSEHLGKLSTAWLAYRELGQSDTDAGRKLEAGRRAKLLLRRLPKLLVRIDDAPSGLVVEINDTDRTALLGIESPVDLGEYAIHATAPGYKPFDTTAAVTTEGKTVKVTIELEEKQDVANPRPQKKKKKKTLVEPSVEVSHRARNGVLVGIAGGVVLVTGGVFGLQARSKWSDAEVLCPDKMCSSSADKQLGDGLVDSARSDATKSTVLVLGGAAIVGVGIYLVVTKKPARSTTAMIAPARGGGAVVLGGRF